MYVNVFPSNTKTNNVMQVRLLYTKTVQTRNCIIIFIYIHVCVVSLRLFYILLQIHYRERFRVSAFILYNNTCFKLYATISVINV